MSSQHGMELIFMLVMFVLRHNDRRRTRRPLPSSPRSGRRLAISRITLPRVLPLLRAPNTSVRPRHPAPRTRDRWETTPRPPDRGKRPGIRPPACASAPNIHFCIAECSRPHPPVRPSVRPPARSLAHPLARPTARPHFIVVFCLAISALLRLRPRAARPPAGAPF